MRFWASLLAENVLGGGQRTSGPYLRQNRRRRNEERNEGDLFGLKPLNSIEGAVNVI